jgi:hypothetical protein
VILDVVDLDGETGVLEQAIWKGTAASKSAGMEQPKSLRTGSTTMIDIVLAPLSHTYLQNRGTFPTP